MIPKNLIPNTLFMSFDGTGLVYKTEDFITRTKLGNILLHERKWGLTTSFVEDQAHRYITDIELCNWMVIPVA